MKNATIFISVFFLTATILPPPLYAIIAKKASAIELSTTYNYGDGTEPLLYQFDAGIRVGKSVAGGQLQTPDGSICDLDWEIDGKERWLNYFFESDDINDLAHLDSGLFTFTLFYDNGLQESTSVLYALPNGQPIPPVTQKPEFIYPQDGDREVPANCVIKIVPAADPAWVFGIWCEPEDDKGIYFEKEKLPPTTTSIPVRLTPCTDYTIGLAIDRAIWLKKNADGIPTVMDKDAEAEIHIHTVYAKTQIQTCVVKAGVPLNSNTDSMAFTGILNISEDEMWGASDIVITIYAEDMPEPKVFTFPINDITFKKKLYNYARSDNASEQFFKLDVKTGKMMFSAKKLNLKGLACPFTITIKVGSYVKTFKMDESIVNGAKPCPPILIQGLVNSLTVEKYAFKPGKAENTDSFVLSGTFTTAGPKMADQHFRLRVGNNVFTVDDDAFIQKKTDIWSCAKAPINESNALMSATLDYTKCAYTIAVKNATISDLGTLPVQMEVFGYTLDGDKPVHFNR